MNGAIARIIARYGIGYIVGAGLISAELGAQISNDPDVIALLDWASFAIGAFAVERFYWLAQKRGWKL